MKNMILRIQIIHFLGVLLMAGIFLRSIEREAQASCGSAFCSINTDWNLFKMNESSPSGVDIRYESIEQDRLLEGTENANHSEPLHHEEQKTINQNWMLTGAHAFNSHWGMQATLPVVHRIHQHIHHHHGEQLQDRWNFTETGDLRLLAHYQQELSADSWGSSSTLGAQFGFKLPTGRYDIENKEGEVAERSLQPGSGTTDLITGFYWTYNKPSEKLSWFSQLQLNYALEEREHFKPGNRWQFDLGSQYTLTTHWDLLGQVNILSREPDGGAVAEPEESGNKSTFLSLGTGYTFLLNQS